MFKKVVALLLFVLFVPGVAFTLPPKSSRMLVLATHALLFVVVSHFVMNSLRESFGNYGAAGCPASFRMNSDGVCKPDPGCTHPSCTLPGIKVPTK
jgi:hypothetical protein